MRVRNRTGVGLVRSAFRRSGLVLPLFVLVFVSTLMVGNPAKVNAQLADGICRVGIAVDRSGSVAIRDPRNPWKLKEQLKSLFRETNGYNNRLNNPNVYLSFWSFGTAASGYRGNPGGITYPAGVTQIDAIGLNNVDYPYYAFSGELWLNSNSGSTSSRVEQWVRQIDRIPFYVNGDVFRKPGFVPSSQYPNWAANYTGTPASLSPFQFDDNTIPNLGSVSGPTNAPGVLPYYGTYINDVQESVVTYFYSNYAGSTNWEAGLGKNNSGYLPGWGGIQRVNEANVVILFTDAIDPGPGMSNSWYRNPSNPEPNLPLGRGYPPGYGSSSHYTEGLAWAHRAADELRAAGKSVVVVSYDQNAKSSEAYKKIVGADQNPSLDRRIIPLGGDDADGMTDLGDVLRDTAHRECSEFAGRPYLRVYGNDARAGASFATQPLCAPSDTARAANVLTYSETSGVNRKGASVQHAVSATGNINDFYSAGRRQGIAQFPNGPKDLTFGNFEGEGLPYNDHRMGYSGMSRCIPDYFTIAQQSGRATAIGNQTEGSKNGNTVEIRSGNVHVSSNITYADSGWTSIDNIPSYTLIVRGGDIYINNSVTRLDGTYIALPDENGNGGRIFTCAYSTGSIPSVENMSDDCNTKLTINGAFIARQVRFHRTNGSINNTVAPNEVPDSGNIAEVFNFSPEIYLGMPPALRRDSSSGRYDSIQSLPPIL